MSATIIQFPRAKKPGIASVERHNVINDLMPRLDPVKQARDDLDERLHRFLVKAGIIKETNR